MKNQLIIIIALFVFGATKIVAQENTELQKQFKADFNFTGIGVSYEIPLSQKWTVDLSTGIGAGVNGSNNYTWTVNASPAAYFKSEFKYIYNRAKSVKKGKNIDNNSGNYIAFQTKYTTKRFSKNSNGDLLYSALLTEFHWGLQRSLGENWLLNIHIGVGVLRNLDLDEGLLYPTAGLKFSYILF